jgi:hypothetical protein
MHSLKAPLAIGMDPAWMAGLAFKTPFLEKTSSHSSFSPRQKRKVIVRDAAPRFRAWPPSASQSAHLWVENRSVRGMIFPACVWTIAVWPAPDWPVRGLLHPSRRIIFMSPAITCIIILVISQTICHFSRQTPGWPGVAFVVADQRLGSRQSIL